jgi:hypothetical protein
VSSAIRYETRPRGDVVDPPEALEFDLFDVRGQYLLSNDFGDFARMPAL